VSDIVAPDTIRGAAPVYTPRSQRRMALERFRQHRLAVASGFVVLAIALLSAFAPIVSPYDPNKTQLLLIFEPPSLTHPMGTDSLGRDLATRILFGGRGSMTVGILAALIAVVVGTVVGAVAGYYGGLADGVLMRLVDVLLSVPRLFILILLSVLFGGTVFTIVLVLGALSWMRTSRIVRATVLSLKSREFVEAARCIGAGDVRIMVRHLLPNTVAPIVVAATLGVAGSIIAESTLSFLGLGVQKPTSTWGNMLTDATTDMTSAPWVAIFPGLAIFLAVVSINFVGDGLRDALDPRRVVGKH
jgi:peptide/nickel transport system permease protein